MRKQIRTTAATAIAGQLVQAEAQIDEAAGGIATLMATMLAARLSANIPASIGHGALSKVGEAASLMLQVRGHLVEAHQELKIAKSQIGLRELAFGDETECPPAKASDSGSNVVSIAA